MISNRKDLGLSQEEKLLHLYLMRLETRHFGSSACCDRAALLALRRDIFKLGEDSKVSLKIGFHSLNLAHF